MALLAELNYIVEEQKKTHRVPKGTFSEPKKWEPSKGRDKDDPHWDWKNPHDNPSGEKPKAKSPVDMKQVKRIAAKIRKAAEDYDEIGPSDLIDNYVNHRQDPELWDEVMAELLGIN